MTAATERAVELWGFIGVVGFMGEREIRAQYTERFRWRQGPVRPGIEDRELLREDVAPDGA
jgi:hypothetical protein